jgi:hypothetical protein
MAYRNRVQKKGSFTPKGSSSKRAKTKKTTNLSHMQDCSFISPSNLVAPLRMSTVLPWSILLPVTTTLTSSGTFQYVLEANNPYDPDYTDSTITYKPQGFSTWGNFYTYYYVTRADLQFEVHNTSTESLACAVGPAADQLSSSYLIFKNLQYCQSKLIPHTGTASFTGISSHTTQQILNTNPRDNTSMRTVFGSPVTQFWYFSLILASPTSSPFTATIQMTIYFHISMSDPKKFAYS